MTMRLGQEGGSIGRGKNNSWVLPDPERFLSSVHMEILFKDGQYFAIDHSTNGTFHNQSTTAIGKGSEILLSDGDSLKLGDYELQVSLLEAMQPSATDQINLSSGPFISHPADQCQPGPLISSVANTPASDQFIPAENINFIPNPQPLFSEQAILDPLVAFSQSEPVGNFSPVGTQGDSENILHHAVSMPQLIPDDWDDVPRANSVESSNTTSTNDITFDTDVAISEDDDLAVDIKSAVVNIRKPSPPKCSRSSESICLKSEDKLVVKTDINQKKSQGKNTMALVANEDLIAAMGLKIQDLTDLQIQNINSVIGEFVQETVKGLMLILNSRSSIKNEFRMSVTTIQSVENNPLKFSPNLDDAMINMFVKSGSAYKDPVASVKEGIESIADHQLSVFAGMRSAFNFFLERFNPELLEAKFNKQKSSVLATKKARNWELYNEFYQDIIKDRDDSFQYLFGDDFVHTYEQQMQKLKQSRSK